MRVIHDLPYRPKKGRFRYERTRATGSFWTARRRLDVDMFDPKAEPVSFCPGGLSRYAFGNRWHFGIECEVQDCDVDPWGTLEPFGSFWLWVGGRAIGNTDVSEQLVLDFSTLRPSVSWSGRQPTTGV